MTASGAASLTGAVLSGTFSVFSDKTFSTGAICVLFLKKYYFFLFFGSKIILSKKNEYNLEKNELDLAQWMLIGRELGAYVIGS